jgi:hypothetical protein
MEKQYWKSTTHLDWIYWAGICRETRNAGLNHIKDCIDTFGFIIDHHLFSDISIGLRIEIEEKKIAPLYMALCKILTMDPFELRETGATAERTIMLNITFTQSTGDLKTEVPAVPG